MHPGVVDISVEEQGEDLLLKTPVPQKRSQQTKNTKSAAETEAGIKHVAACKRKSLNEELVNMTPQGVVTPVAPHQPSESSNLTKSDKDEGGNIEDNALYKPCSNTTPNTLMTNVAVGSPPSPVGKASLGRKKIGENKATVRFREKTLGGSEDKMTLFKKVMGRRSERSESDPLADSAEGPMRLDELAWEHADFGEEPTQFEEVVGAYTRYFEELTQLEGVVSKKGKEKAFACSHTKHVQPKGRPKLRPLNQVELPAATSTHVRAASKPASDSDNSNNSHTDNSTPNPQQLKPRKPKPPKPKSEVAKVKEVLKNSQDTIKKAQEEQKKAQEVVRKVKECVRELGVHDQIRAINNKVITEPEEQHPPHLSQTSRGAKSSTHFAKKKTSTKPDRKSSTKSHALWSIYDFGTDDDSDNVGEVKPAGAQGSGMMRMGYKTVMSEKGRSIKKLVTRHKGERNEGGKLNGIAKTVMEVSDHCTHGKGMADLMIHQKPANKYPMAGNPKTPKPW